MLIITTLLPRKTNSYPDDCLVNVELERGVEWLEGKFTVLWGSLIKYLNSTKEPSPIS